MMILSNGTVEGSWHTGENMHVPPGPVLTITLDGDELDWMMDALIVALGTEDLHLDYGRLTPIL